MVVLSEVVEDAAVEERTDYNAVANYLLAIELVVAVVAVAAELRRREDVHKIAGRRN